LATGNCVSCSNRLTPNRKEEVVVNPVFIVKNWGNNPISVYKDGNLLSANEYRSAIEGTQAVIWVNETITSAAEFDIK
jgi:hypothetical protein